MEQALRESETRFRDFTRAASEFVWENDLDGRFIYVSDRAQAVFGCPTSDMIGRTPADFMPEEETARVREWLGRRLQPDGSFRDLEQRVISAGGEVRWLLVNAVGMFDEHGQRIGQRGAARDITERKQAEARITHLATRDPLTDLPNRVLLGDRLQQALLNAKRQGTAVAVLFIDLDRFKHINDSLGHDVGDELLRHVAARLTECLRRGDTLARLGGDEFVLLLAPIERPEDAAKVAIRILEALARPFSLKRGAEVGTGASIGISVYPHDGEEPETLMKKADLAMYQAKENGRNAFRYHDDDMNASVLARTDLESRLRRGVAHKEFVLHYQPQLAPHSGEIAGVDATVYWRHPERGLVLASDYLAGSEEPGVIVPLTEWMVRTACMQLRVWQEQGLAPMYMTLSLPPGIAERADLTRLIHEALTHARIDPTLLMLNLRPAASRDTGRTPGAMHALQAMGVRLVFDDLGLGTASLAHVAQYPLSMVRLPATLLRGLAREGELVTVARSLIGLLHDLDLGTLTTGVESPAVLSILREANCDLAQGGAIGAAMPPEEIPALLAGSRQRAAAI
jgi:diguanylate cyclase (GGDEF)-like protein/PAS domain S-box-containing protein